MRNRDGRGSRSDQNTKDWKKFGAPLYFIDDHKTCQASKRRHGFIQARQTEGIFQIEVIG